MVRTGIDVSEGQVAGTGLERWMRLEVSAILTPHGVRVTTERQDTLTLMTE